MIKCGILFEWQLILSFNANSKAPHQTGNSEAAWSLIRECKLHILMSISTLNTDALYCLCKLIIINLQTVDLNALLKH